MELLFWLPILGVLLFLALIVGGIVFFVFRLRYKTVTSNQALIITGPNLGDPEKDNSIFTDQNGRSMKVIRGGGFRLKMFQTSTPIGLNSFQIQLRTPKVYTKEGVPVVADAVASVKIADELEGIAKYAEQFLGKKDAEIRQELENVLGTNLRAILSKMTVEDINGDREKFNHDVQEIAQKELNNMGFQITALGLEDLRDADPENGYLENLGRPRVAEVRKKADMAESDAEKETRMYRAKNNQEAQDEENRRQTAISESKKERDLKEASIKEETERARAKSEQAYELERSKLAKEVAEEETKVKLVESQREVDLEQQKARQRKEQADAEAYEIEKRAEAEAKKSRIDGIAKAEIEKAEGLAKAEVIREQGRAEAEAKELMAQAMEKYGEAAVMEMYIKMLPDYAERIAKPLASIQEMKVIDMGGNGSGTGATKIANNVTSTMLGIQESLKEATGMDLKSMLESYVSRGGVTVKNVIKDDKSSDEQEEDTI